MPKIQVNIKVPPPRLADLESGLTNAVIERVLRRARDLRMRSEDILAKSARLRAARRLKNEPHIQAFSAGGSLPTTRPVRTIFE